MQGDSTADIFLATIHTSWNDSTQLASNFKHGVRIFATRVLHRVSIVADDNDNGRKAPCQRLSVLSSEARVIMIGSLEGVSMDAIESEAGGSNELPCIFTMALEERLSGHHNS